MAKMIPSSVSDFHGSYGEEKVYESLAQLPDDYVVFHSVRWNRVRFRGGVDWGESDFAVFHPERGLLVIEVKSGGISCQEGVWYQTNTLTGERTRMKRPPMVQAERSKFQFKDLLSDAKTATAKTYWVECAVWFPSIGEYALIGQMPCEYTNGNVLIQQDLLHAKASITYVYDYYQMNQRQPYTKEDIKEIIRLLAPNFDAVAGLSGRMAEESFYFHRMTTEQSYLLDYLEEQRVAAIQGGAGTGKTMMALEKARRLSETEPVLFLCFNRFLLDYLRETYGSNMPNVTFHNLLSLFASQIGRIDIGNGRTETVKAISNFLNKFDSYDWPYRHIVIDEGQDFAEEHLELLYMIAEQMDGCFYLFYDKNQMIQQRQSMDWVRNVECRLVLTRNCRNTHNIAVTSYKPLGIDQVKMRLDFEGQKPEFHILDNRESALSSISTLIRKYMEQGVQKKDIVILTVKTESTSLLEGKTSVGQYKLARRPGDSGILFTTCRKFKGLESKVVIVTDVDETTFRNEENRRILYAGASRAQHILEIISVMTAQQEQVMVEYLTGHSERNPRIKIASHLKVKISSK